MRQILRRLTKIRRSHMGCDLLAVVTPKYISLAIYHAASCIFILFTFSVTLANFIRALVEFIFAI